MRISGFVRAFLVLALVCISLNAADVTVATKSGSPGATIFLPVTLAGSTNIVAAQFDVVYDARNCVSESALGGDGLKDHVITSTLLTNGNRRVLIYSKLNTPIAPGVFTTLPITVLPGTAAGTLPVGLTNLLLRRVTTTVAASLTQGALKISPPGPAAFGTVLRAFDGSLRFEMSGSEGRSYVVQTSLDLVTWQPLRTNVATEGFLVFNEISPTNSPRRFYRAVLLSP